MQTSAYRIEHRRPGRFVRTLGFADDEGAGRTALQTHATRLAEEGAAGHLVLVEVATRSVVAWHDLPPGP